MALGVAGQSRQDPRGVLPPDVRLELGATASATCFVKASLAGSTHHPHPRSVSGAKQVVLAEPGLVSWGERTSQIFCDRSEMERSGTESE